jgi:hypothetical protein
MPPTPAGVVHQGGGTVISERSGVHRGLHDIRGLA